MLMPHEPGHGEQISLPAPTQCTPTPGAHAQALAVEAAGTLKGESGAAHAGHSQFWMSLSEVSAVLGKIHLRKGKMVHRVS